jgi:hypothetical protein
LTAQADAAFLVQLAQLGISKVMGSEGSGELNQKRQLLRTLKIIAEGVRRADQVKAQAQAQSVDMAE